MDALPLEIVRKIEIYAHQMDRSIFDQLVTKPYK